MTLNNVEKVLSGVGIALRDASDSFRPLEDVIHDVAMRWGELNEVQRAQLSTAIAGTRQVTIFNALMQNYGDTLKYVETQENSAGLASERYAIYLESVEAAQNRLTASWENLWQKTLEAGGITFFLDLTSDVLDFISAIGGLEPILSTIIGMFAILKQQELQKMWIDYSNAIRNIDWKSLWNGIKSLIAQMLGLQTTATATGVVVNTAFGYIGLAIVAITAVVMAFNYASEQTSQRLQELSGEIAKLNEEVSKGESEIGKISVLGDEYLKLKNNVSKTTEEQKRFTEVQNELSSLVPKLSISYDEQGNAIIENVDNLGELLRLKREEIDINNELLQGKLLEQTKLQTKTYADEVKALEDLVSKSKYKGRGGGDMYDISDEDISNQRLKVEESLNEIQQNFLGLTDAQQQSILEMLRASDDGAQKLADTLESLIVKQDEFSGRMKDDIAIFKQRVELTKDYVDKFNSILAATSENLSGDAKTQFDTLANSIATTNQQFKDGQLDTIQYFNILEQELSSANFSEMFAGNQEAAQSFFVGMATNATQALGLITLEFDSGKTSLLQYIEQLQGLEGVFQTISDVVVNSGEMMGMTSEQISGVSSSLGAVSSSISELVGMYDLIDIAMAGMSQNLSFNSDEYVQWANLVSQAMVAVGGTWHDAAGNALNGANDIFQYATSASGSMQVLVGQIAGRVNAIIATVTSSIAEFLRNISSSISNFKGSLYFTPRITTNGTINVMGMDLPFPSAVVDFGVAPTSLGVNVATDSTSGVMDFINSMANDLENWGASNPINLDTFINPGGLGATQESIDSISNSLGGASGGAGGLANNLADAADNANDLKDNLKDAEKAAIDSLKAQLKGYKDIIDARKKMLDSMAEERDYQNQVEEKNNEILQIQTELATLQFDTSEEAEARRLQLEDELASLQGELEDIQFDYSIDQQKEALDAEYQAFESTIESAIQQVQGIQATSLQQFAQQLSLILGTVGKGESNPRDLTPTSFHSGVEMGAVGNQFTMRSNEMFAKLLKGEVVVNPKQMDTFMKTTLPALSEGSSSFSGGDIKIDMPITVQGNLDKSVLPDLERLTETLMGKINEKMMQRGWNRRADLYSI